MWLTALQSSSFTLRHSCFEPVLRRQGWMKAGEKLFKLHQGNEQKKGGGAGKQSLWQQYPLSESQSIGGSWCHKWKNNRSEVCMHLTECTEQIRLVYPRWGPRALRRSTCQWVTQTQRRVQKRFTGVNWFAYVTPSCLSGCSQHGISPKMLLLRSTVAPQLVTGEACASSEDHPAGSCAPRRQDFISLQNTAGVPAVWQITDTGMHINGKSRWTARHVPLQSNTAVPLLATVNASFTYSCIKAFIKYITCYFTNPWLLSLSVSLTPSLILNSLMTNPLFGNSFPVSLLEAWFWNDVGSAEALVPSCRVLHI